MKPCATLPGALIRFKSDRATPFDTVVRFDCLASNDNASSPCPLRAAGLLIGLVLCASGCSLADFDRLSAGLGSGGSGSASGDSGSGGSGSEEHDAGPDGSSSLGGTSGEGGSGGDSGAPPTIVNLLQNPGFEEGPSRWTLVGNPVLTIVTDQPRSGNFCLHVTSRDTDLWEGPGYRLLSVVETGATYDFVVWARMETGEAFMGVTHKYRCIQDTTEGTYDNVASSVPVGSEWSEITAIVTVPTCELAESLIYLEGAPVGENFYIDDTSLTLAVP